MQSFLNFDKMITPAIIKIIFYVFSILSIIAGLIMIITGANRFGGGGIQVLFGLIIMVVGPFLTRIYCELLIVLFKMHKNLHTIAEKYADNKANNIAN